MSAPTQHIPRAKGWESGQGRLLLLYVLARGALGSLALVIGANSLYGVLQGWASTSAAGGWGDVEVLKQFSMVQAVPAVVASVIGISAWSPFGESERTAATSLFRLRLLHVGALLILGVALSWAYLSVWTSRAPDIALEWVAIRNLLGITGAALLLGRWHDARISWIAPLAFATLACAHGLPSPADKLWNPPDWLWNGQAPTVLSSWAISLMLFAVGFGWFLRDGARDAVGEEE